ncbi:MAG: hypothetical protein RBS16_09645, partial [Candidatus Cloacimonadales bacterium]|nr:hypothetical protein [Candidatus Cloacimonadales bacterium]
MIGKLLILETEKNIGKILFEDGRESSTRVFPSTYESGDRIFVKFLDDDPEKKILDMHVENEERYFGSALIPTNERRYRSIIVNYPVLYGLVEYKPSDLSFEITGKSSNVSFNIRKNQNGGLRAINVQRANKSDYYKCISPDFGMLKRNTFKVRTGFVKKALTLYSNYEFYEGKISKINPKTQKPYLSELTTSCGKVFRFPLWLFSSTYQREPNLGDSVICAIDEKNEIIKDFVFIPIKGIINAAGYKSKNATNPGLYGFINDDDGDNIHYLEKDYNLVFNRNSQRNEEVIVTKRRSKAGYNAGCFYSQQLTENHKNRIDLVTIDIEGTEYIISGNEFKNIYKKEAKMGDLVHAYRLKNDYQLVNKEISEIELYTFRKNNFDYPTTPNHFINFQYPLPNDLFLIYMDDINIEEVYKADLTSLPIAISFYKNDKRITKHRLQAIETLINRKYEDTKITQTRLKDERLMLLKSLLSNAIDSGLTAEAEEYQYRLQMLDYSPKNLYRTNPNE